MVGKAVEPKPILLSGDDPISLEIGVGDIPDPNFSLHMDIRALPGVEVVSSWQDASFPEGSFLHIKANQVFEHLNRGNQLIALQKSCSWLAPGGVLEIWTPCLDRLAVMAVEGSITWEWLQRVLYGEQDYDDNIHRNVHTLSTLKAMALASGLIVDSIDEIDGSIKLIAKRPGG